MSVATAISDEAWLWVPRIAGFVIVAVALIIGVKREKRRFTAETQLAMADVGPLPRRQGPILIHRICNLWNELSCNDGSPPNVVLRKSLDVQAHAYEDAGGKSIEITSGLAQRFVLDDPLANAILRHEMAHLVHSDLPAIRWQSLVAAAGICAIGTAVGFVACAALYIFAVTNFAGFPLPLTTTNVFAVNIVIVLGFIIVTVPLVVGAFALRRYAGFIVALIEMRADVSAGAWGDGLKTFSQTIADDPTVAASTTRDIGLAYVSPWISHLPARERINFLASPARLTTPKLRYFAIALALTWLLPFRQGIATWDRLPMIGTVALLQALTVFMVLETGSHFQLRLPRLATLAVALLLTQALPLISLDGPVYLLEHLTASIVIPGGFGPSEGANYFQDTIDTAFDFGSTILQTLGNYHFFLLISIVICSLWILLRCVETKIYYKVNYFIFLCVFIESIFVSFDFFNVNLYKIVRGAAFASSDAVDGKLDQFWSLLPDGIRHSVSSALWRWSEYIDPYQVHEAQSWTFLALPAVTAATIGMISKLGRRGLNKILPRNRMAD